MKLKVLTRFRDESNFFIIHEEGDIIEVNNPDRVTRLIEGGFCVNADNKKPYVSEPETEQTAPEQTEKAKPVEEKPKRGNRKKKEA